MDFALNTEPDVSIRVKSNLANAIEVLAMTAAPNVYRCRACGATSYRRLTERSPDGAMRYSAMYRCSGCSFTFSEPAAWRERRLRARIPRQVQGAIVSPRDRTAINGRTDSFEAYQGGWVRRTQESA